MKNPKQTTLKQSSKSGQVLVEYMLMLLLVVGVVSSLGFGFRKTVKRFWADITNDVANPGPHVPEKKFHF